MSDPNDLRGHMHRANRLMPDEEARAFLRTEKVGHVATRWRGRIALHLDRMFSMSSVLK